MEDLKLNDYMFSNQEIAYFLLLFRVITHGEEGLQKVAELMKEDPLVIRKLKIKVHDFLEKCTNMELDFEPINFNEEEQP